MKRVDTPRFSARLRALPMALLLAGAMVPAGAAATCNVEIINQRTVVTATVVLGLSESCSAPIAAFPSPFTCETEVLGLRSGGNDSFHQYDSGMPDLAECTTQDEIVVCYADGQAPPSDVAFECKAEIHRALLDLFPATATSACGCASLKSTGR
ncbi:hypothetical protein [Lysobacter gummosus]|jgi:hypothetical protein|uniref:Secreted protein n=1 Tax=Lysobacter gummosus TaxID=262324 RepID=A0ABY3XIN2_9GAMM|nr:hypothetical protein [Lysobacter gummosus]ALN91046.1 hypothetical protein LG3211_2077 [Lysobacter gummosus]UNP31478.1 hypothetical protein MOV92_09640 [Lysobacter gummosus]